MSRIIMITGGARSGKSSFAEKLCKEQNSKVAYIATSVPFDEGMKDRIEKHRKMRPNSWTTYEVYKDIYKYISDISTSHEVVLLDCITLLINNLMFDFDIDWDNCKADEVDSIEEYIQNQITLLIDEIRKTNLQFVFVSNEIGMGVVPANRLSRIYTDIAGRINQRISSLSDEVYFVVSGIPIKIK
ncbi:bifunctional adenosylcobinamide kinase/adenosylcobinamide-phosphate guanylyltransferase [Alkalithermobacter paradoxus]|uniref:Adenosylcobinamide kinase n=1 Tax=Alkalithermobacter paradoxus TaxID=29349 RepID=A0A1V4I7D9_9FIRM|nr:bifunctional adenosylcobalamin biosynthesis protein CobU [[Clostridium] thermoalcaliphilum]